ncbi:hypothetical protein L2U69_15625 [Zavarzinia compransoris]|uniref:hypothetical protein n=1 Tax=Zavarzinia marina TaxID=2911065 RepID=UPI001F1704A1|nr:hypothetical protein [Zavarzinia marina]MCF4167083.1 hypothetical protein [Zavarzinia marina]
MRPRPDRHGWMRRWRAIATWLAVAACLVFAVLPATGISAPAPGPTMAQGAAAGCDGAGHGPVKAVPTCCTGAACPMFAAVPTPALRAPEPVRPVPGDFRVMITQKKDGAGYAPPYRPPRPAV